MLIVRGELGLCQICLNSRSLWVSMGKVYASVQYDAMRSQLQLLTRRGQRGRPEKL
jgi:hypothetical protein